MRTVLVCLLAGVAVLAGACRDAPGAGRSAGEARFPGTETLEAADPGPSWAPRPVTRAGLTGVATVEGDTFALHTAHGEVGFLPGVNVGSTVPGRQPGELAVEAEDYRRWFPLMRRLGIRVVRVYTIHPPAFYDALAEYNRAHPAHPLYLAQGVYLPDESYVEEGDLYDGRVTRAMDTELRDAVAAVHGDLERDETPGRADGTWTADVTPWLTAWIAGVEWDPVATRATDRRNPDAPAVRGEYVRSTADATPTERWLAARLETLAAADAARGHTAPLAFVNWPTTDPLAHPEEPLPHEDLVGVDANHVRATGAWPGGVFASYHAYPYYPDFQRHEPALQDFVWRGRTDPYAGYLDALRRHHADMPVMVTEFGVPSSWGSAHGGPLGRDQGGHTEEEALATDAAMLRDIRDLGFAGGFLFAWTDEWFKRTWNTEPHQVPAERRQLWHDVWTNEQHFGVLATDATGGPDAGWRAVSEGRRGVREVAVSTDEAFLHVRVRLDAPPDGPLTLGFDSVPGGVGTRPDGEPDATSDHVTVLGPGATGQAYVRRALDPLQLDGVPVPDEGRAWHPLRLTTNRALVVPGTGTRPPERRAPEYQEVGRLRRGETRPGRPGYDSGASWRVDGRDVVVRVPWAQLGMADPSSRQALVPAADGTATTRTVDRLGLVVDAGDGPVVTEGVVWEPWNRVYWRERLKAGAQVLADAYAAVSR